MGEAKFATMLKVAEDLRRAAAELEAQHGQAAAERWPNPAIMLHIGRFAWALLLTALMLFIAFYVPW